jgi:hypothetical protein
MKIIAATAAIAGLFVVAASPGPTEPITVDAPSALHGPLPTASELTEVVEEYCVRCHSERRMTGNLSLEGFDVAQAASQAEVGEKVILKLRAGMMPPAGARRPTGDTLSVLAVTLEETIDRAASRTATAGRRVFQRLNQTEYERSVKQLLDIEVDASAWLPLDTRSANFDNIADVQIPSATTLDAYLSAAAEISRLAVGYPNVTQTTTAYKVSRLGSQTDREEGAPRGTRGGIAVSHFFPADGEYTFAMEFHAGPVGELYGRTAPFDEHIELSIDGERVALLPIDRWSTDADPNGLIYQTELIPVTAGPHMVAAAFLRTFEGPVNDNLRPIGHSIADTQIGQEYGINNETHLRDLFITGPFRVTGISPTPSRQRIFSCRPVNEAETRPCAREILGRIGTEAYRRPLTDGDLSALLSFYDIGAETGGFENGVRMGIQAILASPHFVFRMEELPEGAEPGEVYRLNDADLASRLAFFLWGLPPDGELLRAVADGELSTDDGLARQARRMLADPRSDGLATRFASQWLRLQDLEKMHPDALEYPDYDLQIAQDLLRETELFFDHLVREDRPFFELLTADYTFMNERLARHYGYRDISGNAFRQVSYPDDQRRGLFGHGSVLTLTSHPDRTSPVLRGKWVMEVLMGTPPPPPPPNVPKLEESTDEASEDGLALTTGQRMAMHRANPTCNSCHSLIDPIGLAFENFDVTGTWRIRERGAPVDVSGELYDGTPLSGPADLRAALLGRPIPLVRNFTKNLMAYALGRRLEYFDMPAVRAITSGAADADYRMSSFILGVVQSDAFRLQQATSATTDAARSNFH